MGFPTKNDDFGVFWGYHHLRKHPSSPFILFSCSCFFFFRPIFLVHPGFGYMQKNNAFKIMIFFVRNDDVFKLMIGFSDR